MAYDVILAPAAVEQFKALKANVRAAVRAAMDRHLGQQPTQLSKSRIKRLRGLTQPQYRLRVEDIRVFYDVGVDTVDILAIVSKAQADAWLKEKGVQREEGRASKGEG